MQTDIRPTWINELNGDFSMRGERLALDLQLVEVDSHLADLHEQLRNKWLMGKDRLVVEYKLRMATRDYLDFMKDYMSNDYVTHH